MRLILAALSLFTLAACAHTDAPEAPKRDAMAQEKASWWCNFLGNCQAEKDVQCGFYGKCPGKSAGIHGDKPKNIWGQTGDEGSKGNIWGSGDAKSSGNIWGSGDTPSGGTGPGGYWGGGAQSYGGDTGGYWGGSE